MLTFVSVVLVVIFIWDIFHALWIRLVPLILTALIPVSLLLSTSFDIAWLVMELYWVIIDIIVSFILAAAIFASLALISISLSFGALAAVLVELVRLLPLGSRLLPLTIIVWRVPVRDIALAAFRLRSLLAFAVVVPLRRLHLNLSIFNIPNNLR